MVREKVARAAYRGLCDNRLQVEFQLRDGLRPDSRFTISEWVPSSRAPGTFARFRSHARGLSRRSRAARRLAFRGRVAQPIATAGPARRQRMRPGVRMGRVAATPLPLSSPGPPLPTRSVLPTFIATGEPNTVIEQDGGRAII